MYEEDTLFGKKPDSDPEDNSDFTENFISASEDNEDEEYSTYQCSLYRGSNNGTSNNGESSTESFNFEFWEEDFTPYAAPDSMYERFEIFTGYDKSGVFKTPLNEMIAWMLWLWPFVYNSDKFITENGHK